MDHATTQPDTSVVKLSSTYSPRGSMGQKYLASGIRLSMRLWQDEPPGPAKAMSQRDYETLGYVIAGRAELHLGNQAVLLGPGDSWLVPKGLPHAYKILESFTAVEATSPPAAVHGRDESYDGGNARVASTRGRGRRRSAANASSTEQSESGQPGGQGASTSWARCLKASGLIR